MLPLKPYLVKAVYDCILGSDLTPYVLIDATCPEVTVPENMVENGKIILNMSTNAITQLIMDKTHVEFYAKFSGIKTVIDFPIKAVLAIYAKETGEGMVFDPEPEGSLAETFQLPEPSPPIKPKLTVVK